MFVLLNIWLNNIKQLKTIKYGKITKVGIYGQYPERIGISKNSQTAVLKKLAQIEADNITLGVSLLEKKLPDLHEEVDSSVITVTDLLEEFQEHRDKFFVDNKLAALKDPTV